jgi:tetratricopeptide (TPR) repeat protein
MGRIKQQVNFDWVGADASLQRAIALEPGNPESARSAASSAAILGRFDKALPMARRANGLDLLNAESWESLAEIEVFIARKSLALSPDAWPGPMLLSEIYVMQGRPQGALAEIELIRSDLWRAVLYPIVYHALGWKKEADTALRELIAKYHEGGAFQIAEVYAFRNQSDETFNWLDRAYT